MPAGYVAEDVDTDKTAYNYEFVLAVSMWSVYICYITCAYLSVPITSENGSDCAADQFDWGMLSSRRLQVFSRVCMYASCVAFTCAFSKTVGISQPSCKFVKRNM